MSNESGVSLRVALALVTLALTLPCPGCSTPSGSPSLLRSPRAGAPPTRSKRPPPDPAPSSDSTGSTTASAAGASTPPAASDAAEARTAPVPADRLRIRTERLNRALRALELGPASKPVRVLWLGDSHAAADYWPHALRARLQQRFGVGGPGFINLGLQHYRHADVAVQRRGRWRVEPEPPASRTQHGDGAYGLGGVRTVPLAPDSRATVSLGPRAVRGRVSWRLFLRLDNEQSGLTVRLGARTQTVRREPAALSTLAPIAVDLEGEPTDSLTVLAPTGQPRLFGAIVESQAPGVVVDSLGINGARVATALAWAQEPWELAVSAREPDLVIVEYGTNEVFDALAPKRYEKQYEALLARIANASPEAACLLVGPTAVGRGGLEAQQRASRIEAVQRATAERLGCSFFSPALAMGGHDAFARWSQLSPPLATRDGVHLTPAGYEVLGEAMADMLLGEYERFVGLVPRARSLAGVSGCPPER